MITTDVDFPKELPCALREGYAINHESPFQRTKMVSGRSVNRRRFTSVPSRVRVSWLFTDVQASLFEAWFRDRALDGAAWFNMVIKAPIGMVNAVCQFVDMYEGPIPEGLDWLIRAEIELFERPLLSPGWGEISELVLGASIIDYAANREWPEA